MWPPGHLHGFEVDLNRLIDAYALQAHQEQTLSFKTFKRLFCFGSFAYLHQAYPGCEHNAEYTQLLFATVLDRLDILSPTAAATSPLWALHASQQQEHWQQHLQAACAVHHKVKATHSSPATPAVPHVTAAHQGAGTSHGSAHHEHYPDQQQQQQQPWEEEHQEQHLEQQQPQWQQGGHWPDLLAASEATAGHPCQLQQQSDAVLCSRGKQQDHPDPQQQPVSPGTTQDLGQQLLPSQQLVQQQLPQHEADADFFSMLFGPGSPLPDPHCSPVGTAGGVGTASVLAGEPGVVQLQSPDKFLTMCGGDDDEDGFLTDLLAILDEATADAHDTAGPLIAPVPAGEPGVVRQLPPAATAAAEAAAAEAAAAGGTTVSVGAAAGGAAGRAAVVPMQQQQQISQQGLIMCQTPVVMETSGSAANMAAALQLQPPVVKVPIEVKAAVVFLLHCLYHTQLNLPKICIYTPLQLVRHLTAAAADFKSAGPAAADPLQVLQVMLQQQQLLVGQFRRPNIWIANTPTWLVPDAVDPATASREAAIRAAARRAAAKTHGGIRAAAVTAAVNAAKSLGMASSSAVEPHAHREAMFHIKTALKSLSNFRTLQQLCTEYSSTRRSIFEPLLGLKEQQRQTHQAEDSRNGRRRSGPAVGSQKRQVALQTGAPGAQQHIQQAVEPPDLFDGQFGQALQQLANDEASRMLMLLDPCHNPNQVKKRLAEQQRAEKEAAAAAEREAAAKLRQFRIWLQPDGVCRTSKKRSRDPSAVGLGAEVPGRSYVQDVRDAGIFHAAELDELQSELAEQTKLGSGMSGAAKHVMQLQLHRRQHTLAVAEEWFTAHDSLMQHDGEDDDMP